MRKLSIFILLLCACGAETQPGESSTEEAETTNSLFSKRAESATGIDFSNTLTFKQDFNIYTYRNYYNGGGVAMGDVNNDGLTDLYFSGNMVSNRLYLNQGELSFEDVTEVAGTGGEGGWSTGVSMADVNGDGWLDIYVCNSGELDGDNKQNELFINNQDGTFTEAAESWGVADRGYGTHGVFFDYDKDGDLDLYLLNNSYQAIGSFNLRKNERPKRDPVGGDKLFRNDLIGPEGPGTASFTDVSEAAGIYGSVIGFGLGVTVGDVNRDGWQDIYVSNDFFERDYLYINQADGTFRETLTESMKSISAASMGADMADINNDGYGDIFVTEMLPRTNARIKTATTFENWNRYQYNLENDYYHQFTRNMLQRNNGDGTFSEIGRLSGVEATDWSWGALIFDMDNDGYKDLFVANGIYQDLTNRDFLDYIADDEVKRSIITKDGVDFRALVDAIPSNPVPNYAFRNAGPEGDYRYQEVSEDWGLDHLGFSNGSAYGDLDNDGDLDLVVNNTNAPALVFENRATDRMPEHHWLQLQLKGTEANTAALGARATVYAGDEIFYLEHMPMRGFESTIDGRLHFGLGDHASIDSLVIQWPNDRESRLTEVASNQLLTVGYQTAEKREARSFAQAAQNTPFDRVAADRLGLNFSHQENRYSDFDKDPLIYHMQSADGPSICTGDFNGDGETDFYVGGAKGQSGALYLFRGGAYERIAEPFSADAMAEETDCVCFDADGDGDQDLYVVHGSSEFNRSDLTLVDGLYFNEGNGRSWTKSKQLLPISTNTVTGSCVAPHDVDGDGDLDLFVGSRLRPGLYGAPSDSYLLLNDGQGKFKNNKEVALRELGLVTDATWSDINGDGREELLIVGEWMSPRAFSFVDGALVDRSQELLPANLSGWYHTLTSADLDGDGDTDFVLGNHGLNSRFRASPERPVMLHLNDFDQNGKAEQIISVWEGDRIYPMALLHDLNKQMPGLRKRYVKYATFGDQAIEDIFDPELLSRSVVRDARELRSLILLNDGGQLSARFLPIECQESPLFAISARDIDGDGDQDLITGGNFYYAKPEVGRYDADWGDVLINDGNANFTALSPTESGFRVDGEIRALRWLTAGSKTWLLVGKNDEPLEVFTLQADPFDSK